MSQLNIQSVQRDYVAKMKNARLLAQTVPWCCEIHKLLAIALLDSVKRAKDSYLSAFVDGRITEEVFVVRINAQNIVLDGITNNMENVAVFGNPEINVGSVGAS